MSQDKLSLDDIFADDEFGILDAKPQKTYIKTEEDRLIDAFEEINQFIDKNKRKPSKSSMYEFSLLAKLNNFRKVEAKKKILKPFDRHNLLGHVEMDLPSLEDIFEDDLGILDGEMEKNTDDDIFTYRHIPKDSDRAKTDFVARRKPLSEKEFAPYEKLFHQVHREIKTGKRRIVAFDYDALEVGNFYISDGIMLYLESYKKDKTIQKFKSGTHNREDGRTRIIFENGTLSNMMFQSLYKNLHSSNGRVVVKNHEIPDLFVNSDSLTDKDEVTGYVYVLTSKSTHPDIQSIANLHKIGFASTSVEDRTKNAKHEATYLFADVEVVEKYKVANINADTLERLLHKVFAKACLDIELKNEQGKFIDPREWFVVPFSVINEAIQLIVNGNILDYKYDEVNQALILTRQT